MNIWYSSNSITVWCYQFIEGFVFSGAKNLDELELKLKQHLMIRRLKKNVLTQLPPKRRQKVPFDLKFDSKTSELQKVNTLCWRCWSSDKFDKTYCIPLWTFLGYITFVCVVVPKIKIFLNTNTPLCFFFAVVCISILVLNYKIFENIYHIICISSISVSYPHTLFGLYCTYCCCFSVLIWHDTDLLIMCVLGVDSYAGGVR